MSGSGTGTPVTPITGTTSGVSDYTINRTEIINLALQHIGVLYSGQSVIEDSNMHSDCIRVLNLMLKSWQNKGIMLWTRKEKSIQFAENQKDEILSINGTNTAFDTPLRIVFAYRHDLSNVDVELRQLSGDEYFRLSRKDAKGTPTQFWYNYQNEVGYLTPWPTPSSSTNIIIVYHKQYDNMDNSTDIVDFPQSWQEAVVWNLALRLCPMFGRVANSEVIGLASQTLQEAIEGSYEEGSVFLQPNPRFSWNLLKH